MRPLQINMPVPQSCGSSVETGTKTKTPHRCEAFRINMAATYSPVPYVRDCAVPSAMRGLTSLFGPDSRALRIINWGRLSGGKRYKNKNASQM